MPVIMKNAYLEIHRNGTEITAIEYAHLASCRTKSSAITMEKECQLTFTLAGMSPQGVVDDLHAEIFRIMEIYIFSPNDVYTVYGGYSKDSLNPIFKGTVAGSPAAFPEDGQIGFSVTLNNGLGTDPNSSQDVASPETWEAGVPVYRVMQDTAKAVGRTLVAETSQLAAELTKQTYKDGTSRPNLASTNGFLKTLCDMTGCYLDDNVDGKLYVRKINGTVKKSPSKLYQYRSINGGTNASDENRCFSFMPDLENPIGNLSSVANGVDSHSGKPVDTDNQNPKTPTMNTVPSPPRTGASPPDSSNKGTSGTGDSTIQMPIDVLLPPKR